VCASLIHEMTLLVYAFYVWISVVTLGAFVALATVLHDLVQEHPIQAQRGARVLVLSAIVCHLLAIPLGIPYQLLTFSALLNVSYLALTRSIHAVDLNSHGHVLRIGMLLSLNAC
jgi:hypothetical protein